MLEVMALTAKVLSIALIAAKAVKKPKEKKQ